MFEQIYDGLPPLKDFESFVSTFSTCTKLILLCVVISKYGSTKNLPFSRSVFQFAAMGAITKILYFQGPRYLGMSDPIVLTTMEDLSFCFPLVGVVVTMGLDFLWALSSTMEKNPVFRNNISEVDFVNNLFQAQVVLVPSVAAARHLPLPWQPDLVLNWTILIVLFASFGFIWYCLGKVHGTSDSTKFQNAFSKALVANSILSMILINLFVHIIPVMGDFNKYVRPYIVLNHLMEAIGVFGIVSFFAFFKAAPADLQDHTTSMNTMGEVLKAKSKFKGLLGKKNKQGGDLKHKSS